MSEPELLTIGYERCTLDRVLATLIDAQVMLLIDVRALAASRKPGFSKRQLAAGLDEKGMRYLHLQALGTPKPGRDAVRAGRPERMQAIYLAHIAGDQPQAELAQATALVQRERSCLLCFERDPTTCHRHIITEMIAFETGQKIKHLFA